MNVLLLIDDRFWRAERALVSRLEIGLADEGVRVVHTGGSGSDDSASEESFATRVALRDESFLIPPRIRARWLLERVAGALEKRSRARIDVVHVLGETLWGLGRRVAEHAGAALALEGWSVRSVERRGRERDREGSGTVLLADEGLVEAAEAAGVGWRLTPWGVHASSSPIEILREDRAPSIVLMGTGADRRALREALIGVSRAIEGVGFATVFVDHEAAHAAGLWSLAGECGMRDRLSLIQNLETDRQLILRSDLLVASEAIGEVRSLILDAMGAGMAVVAARDGAVSAVVEHETAMVVDEADASRWAEAVSTLLADRRRARELGRGGWMHVREHRRASAHVSSVLDTYEWLTSADALPFPGEQPGPVQGR